MSDAIPRLIMIHLPACHWFDRTRWQLAEPIEIFGTCIPEGFITDGASVPRLLWWLFPPHGRYMAAAVLHDFLLQESSISRQQADAAFLEAMQKMGVTPWRRWIMYVAVRLRGWISEVCRE